MENTDASQTVSKTFLVSEGRLPGLQKIVERLQKRAAKLGCDPIIMVVGSQELGEREGHTIAVRYSVTISGKPPQAAGWTFGASLLHFAGGETVIRNLSLFEAPTKYRTAGPDCEHCGYKRRRNDTFLVFNEQTEWKQVGSTCLKDFLGSDVEPTALVAQAEMMAEAFMSAEAAAGDRGVGGGRSRHYPILDFLAHCFQVVRVDGKFISKKEAWEKGTCATATKVVRELDRDTHDYVRPADGDFAKAQMALDHVLDIQDPTNGTALEEFVHNIRAIARNGAVESRTAGYAASIVLKYENHLRDRRSATDSRSEYVGKPGDKLQIKVRVREVRDMGEKTYGGQTNISYLHTFVDAQYHLYKWWASGVKLVQDQVYTLDATIKSHDDFRGIKYTTLTRCREAKKIRPQQQGLK